MCRYINVKFVNSSIPELTLLEYSDDVSCCTRFFSGINQHKCLKTTWDSPERCVASISGSVDGGCVAGQDGRNHVHLPESAKPRLLRHTTKQRVQKSDWSPSEESVRERRRKKVSDPHWRATVKGLSSFLVHFNKNYFPFLAPTGTESVGLCFL